MNLPKPFTSTSVVPTRASSFLEPVLTDTLSDADTVADNKLPLEKEQSQLLLKFLYNHGVSLLDKPSNVDTKAKPCVIDLFPSPEVNRFVEGLFASAEDVGEARRLISWVELPDMKLASLKEPFPRRFVFVLHRDMVVRRRQKLKEGGSKYSYDRRSFMRLEFMHSYAGRAQQPTLDLRCDLTSFMQNPSAKYSLGRELSSDDEKQLVFLLDFLLFPLRELCRITSGELVPQSWLSRREDSDDSFEVLLTENAYKPVVSSRCAYPIFTKKDFRLNSRLEAPYLSKLHIDSLSFSFQPTLSKSALSLVLQEDGVPTKVEAEAKAHLVVNKIVALQSAIFSSRRYYGEGSSGFSNIKVEASWNGVSSAWKDAPDAVLRNMSDSAEHQQIERVGLRIFRPVYNHNLYTVHFRTFDAAAIRKQFRNYGEYEHVRMSHERTEGGVPLPSAEHLTRILNRSVEINVSVHSRVLSHNFGIRTVENLKQKILADYDGKVSGLSMRIIQMALNDSGVYYWNISKQWAGVTLSTRKQFKARLDRFFQRKVVKHHFEEIDDVRWEAMAKLPEGLVNEDPATTEWLQSLFKLDTMYESKNKIKRIRSIPEIATAVFLLWYVYPSENLWDILVDCDFVPDEWKQQLLVPRTTGNPQQKAMHRLIREVSFFVEKNFGVKLNHSRDLHQEVARKSAEVLGTLRTRVHAKTTTKKTQIRPELLLDQSALGTFSYPSYFFRDLKKGSMFVERTSS